MLLPLTDVLDGYCPWTGLKKDCTYYRIRPGVVLVHPKLAELVSFLSVIPLVSAGLFPTATPSGRSKGHEVTQVIQLPRMNCDGLWGVVLPASCMPAGKLSTNLRGEHWHL